MFKNDKVADIIHVLQKGGIFLYPTDTIWGLGCDATNPEAVEKISQLKNRVPEKGYVILVDSMEMLRQYVVQVHPRIDLLLLYHERPLTVVYDAVKGFPANVLAPDGSAGIRIVQDPFCKMLIQELGKPIISTSANISGEPFPINFGNISSAIIQGVDYVAKHRREEKMSGEPSVIVRLGEGEELEFLRN